MSGGSNGVVGGSNGVVGGSNGVVEGERLETNCGNKEEESKRT